MIGRISLLNASRESTRIFLARAADALSPGEYLVLFFACMPRPGYPPKLTVKADVAGWQPWANSLCAQRVETAELYSADGVDIASRLPCRLS